jgi:putative ABC transport system substrate-binding protein
MRRRKFILLLGATTVAWPLGAYAQQPPKLPTIGFFSAGSAAATRSWVAALVNRLRELGWIEGRTVAIEKQATSIIPIVFAAVTDAIGSGLVASLPRPGGNATGLSDQQADSAGKRVELLREVMRDLRRLAIMANAGMPGAVLDMHEVEAAARTLALETVTMEIRRTEDITSAFEALGDRAGALYVCGEPLVFANRIRINSLAAAARLPTMYGLREYVEAGGLISYGASMPNLFRRSGDLVDKILRGARPDDIPVEQPTKFDLVINLTTAKALRLTIPESFLSRADEVIE